MAPPDNDQDIIQQGESLKTPVTAQDGEVSQTSQTTGLTTFYGYIHLPFELRAQIRKEAMEPAGKRPKNKKPRSLLAAVSKEWQDDVERLIFGKIRIDPSNEGDVASFKRLFTGRRQRFLTRLDITIDDNKDTSPWYERSGLLRISQVMEKVGHFFHYISGWDFWRDGEKQQSIAIIFTSACQGLGRHPPKYEQPYMTIRSSWEKKHLDRLTARGLVPANVALWAIKSEFPSSLNMVTHLTFLPDCVPLPAAQKIIQTVPNLETCVLEVSFGSESEEGWKNLTGRIFLAPNFDKVYETQFWNADFILQLRVSAPSLRKLMLYSQDYFSRTLVPPSMRMFAEALREYSQSLEILRASPFDLHPDFFLPFSEKLGPTVAASNWRWPRLQRLELSGISEVSDWDPGQLKLSPADVLVAAGRAAIAMPILKAVKIVAATGEYFYIERELSDSTRGMENTRMGLAGFDKSERPRISAAWRHFLGAEVKLVSKKKPSAWLPPLRVYKPVSKTEAGF